MAIRHPPHRGSAEHGHGERSSGGSRSQYEQGSPTTDAEPIPDSGRTDGKRLERDQLSVQR